MLDLLAVVYLVLTLYCLAVIVESPERAVRGLVATAWQLSAVALAIAVLAT